MKCPLIICTMSLALTAVFCLQSKGQSPVAPPTFAPKFAVARFQSDALVLTSIEMKPITKEEQVTEMVPVETVQEQTYTVEVPYTVTEDRDGKAVTITKMRTETRTRQVTVVKMVPQTRVVSRTRLEPQKSETKITRSELKLLNSIGEPIAIEDIESRLENPTPVVLIPAGQKFEPFFKEILRQEAIIVVLPVRP